MAILYDARGNEIRSAFPDTVTNEVVTDPRPITAVLGATNAEVAMDLNGCQVATFDMRTSAGALTLVAEGTIDGVNYFALPIFVLAQSLNAVLTAEQYVPSIVLAAAQTHFGQYTLGVSGLRRVRIRASVWTSGNVTIAFRGSVADLIIYTKPIPATLHVTATGASGAAVTASLPAAGVGLFHYITKVHLVQFVVAARTAAAAPVLATTTNLPGSPVYSCDATVGAVGQIIQYDLGYAIPLKSLLANTATTFVGPATVSTIWRWNISYYVGA